ncbi:hypothetical protein GCM10010365_66630 [Streptomyces poonensis]|uniref:Uncharacterized protein n=1 Tax=Streptomyces poonensis TaxID=68255 RepID=A0A918UV42_9ACTN|nr:hypothetical protein GCM10010365_66630 [Streptomyces poonensis]GLJ90064.1 hypothetical protein GCM10017589_26650 [Streptomyces poonensis]
MNPPTLRVSHTYRHMPQCRTAPSPGGIPSRSAHGYGEHGTVAPDTGGAGRTRGTAGRTGRAAPKGPMTGRRGT